MKRIRVQQLDDRTAQQLDAVAPARSRKRSALIRQAIASALLEHAEHATRAAYARVPDADPAVDPAEWSDAAEALRRSPSRRTSNSAVASGSRHGTRSPRSTSQRSKRRASSAP